MSIHKALVAAFSKTTNVVREKDGQVGNQKYKYATLESVLDMLHPILKETGLAVIQYAEGDKLHTTTIHEGGEVMAFGYYDLGAMGKHQERGSAITYGRRYMLCSIFGIAQEDDDGAKADPEVKSIFTSAAKRKEFGNGIIRLIDEACDQDELAQTYKENAEKLRAMRDNNNEYDVMLCDELIQRFTRKKTQLNEEMARLDAMKQQLTQPI